MKVLRDGANHTIKELTVGVMLGGKFDSSYTAGDNSLVVPTDTMKNTVNVLVHQQLGTETERFVLSLTEHFLAKYPQVDTVNVEVSERVWDRLIVDDAPHPHSFTSPQQMRPFSTAAATRHSQDLRSGVSNLLILKSTASGFSGFPRDEFTTLPETDDRIFATEMTARWAWSGEPKSYASANQAIITALLRPFAKNHSPSVQATLFQMGEAALGQCPEISEVQLSMPNKHCLLLDLQPFGLSNGNELFVPVDEPHGQIDATVIRD
jgi:urate oxidase